MAKVSMIQRELKRTKLVRRHGEKRSRLKEIIRSPKSTDEEVIEAQLKLQKLPDGRYTAKVYAPDPGQVIRVDRVQVTNGKVQ